MGGSGGGSAGKSDWPAYMKDFHGELINDTGADTITQSIVVALNAAVAAGSPFAGVTAFDPDDAIEAAWTRLLAADTAIVALDPAVDVPAAIAEAIAQADIVYAEDSITAESDAYSEILEDQLENQVLPIFKAGMLNLNAVNSSSFVIGESVLRAFKGRDVAKYTSELRYRRDAQRLEFIRSVALDYVHTLLNISTLKLNLAQGALENRRLYIIAKNEEIDTQASYNEKEALWDLELYQYPANMLASIAGGVGMTGPKGPSKAASVLGGALSGAATGAAVSGGNPYAVAAGAIVGGVAGYLQ